MKKIFFSAAMMAMFATSCQNEAIVENQEVQAGSQLITLEVKKGADSRTHLGQPVNGITPTYWSAGDKIYVSGKNGGVAGVLTLKSGANSNRGEFEGYILGGKKVDLEHIVFPAPKNGKINMTDRDPSKLDAPMIGTIEDGEVNKLTNVGSLLAVDMRDVEGKVYGIKVTSNGNNMTGGYYEFDEELGTLKYIPADNLTEALVMEDGKAYVSVATTTNAVDAEGSSEQIQIDNIVVSDVVTDNILIETETEINLIPGDIYGDDEVIELDGTFVSTLEELQAAVDKGENVVFANDIKGDLTIVQKPDVQIAINGNNKKFFGAIIVNGGSARHETAALTIKKINFFGGADMDAYINLGVSGDTNTRYTNNVTVEGCIFDGEGDAMVAVKSYTGGDLNLTLNGCIVNKGMHSLGQLKNVEKNLIVSNCFVYSKNGLNINNSNNLDMTGCTFDVQGYAVRFGADANTTDENFSITGGTLKSACAESDDAVIVFRAGAVNATLTLTGTTLIGSRKFIGNTEATTIVEK